MNRSTFFSAALVAFAAACGEHTTTPPTPAGIRITAGDAQSGTVGKPLPVAPTFVVTDERGNAIANVPVAVSVVAGGGTLVGAPTVSVAGPTSVGTWTLGTKSGENRLQVEVAGLAPVLIGARGAAGVAAKIVALTPQSTSARVGDVIAGPSAAITDALDNPLAGATVVVTTSGGGSVPTSNLTTDFNGRVDVGSWGLGTQAGTQTITLSVGAVRSTFVATVAPGDPVGMVVVSGDAQRSAAGAPPPQPIVLRVVDRYGNGVSGQNASLLVTSGDGSAPTGNVVSAADGTIAISSWTLGRSAVPQSLRVTSGAFAVDVSAVIASDYNIEVRFFGPTMTPDQKALFTNAAARLSGIITGDIPANSVASVNLGVTCGISGLPPISETIDDVVIYATVRPIDGARGILARAGPCISRQPTENYLTLVGVMEFDVDDLALMAAQGTLQGVITHEMLHVLGVGTLWSLRGLLAFQGTPAIGYVGGAGQDGCIGLGGFITCEQNVPVENMGGPGTVGSHWRESTFQSELMTGYVNGGGMPLSQITVGSLRDLGYVVNPFAADPYQVPGTFGASPSLIPGPTTPWEAELPTLSVIDGKGGSRVIRTTTGSRLR